MHSNYEEKLVTENRYEKYGTITTYENTVQKLCTETVHKSSVQNCALKLCTKTTPHPVTHRQTHLLYLVTIPIPAHVSAVHHVGNRGFYEPTTVATSTATSSLPYAESLLRVVNNAT